MDGAMIDLGTWALSAASTVGVAAVAVLVTFEAQRRRFEGADRLAYRPVYARRRNVHRPVRSFGED